MSVPTQGQRVIHHAHPEYGFGAVRLVEEDAFGDVRCQVDFEHRDGYAVTRPEDLEVVGWPLDDFASGLFGSVETFKRKTLAALLVGENNRTGAFLRIATQPLPHQAFLLDKVLSGNRFGHVAADDVGLGKTIEAGLVINSLLQQERDCRVLIICPAGLVLQWQDEMEEHFCLYFSIAGRDFNPLTKGGWQGRQLVIAPLDTAKREEQLAAIHAAGPFHIVVCDEAHRLSARREFLTGDLRTTANYRLFRELIEARTVDFISAGDGSPRSPRLLMLSATPHQGDDLRFGMLLKLARPDIFVGEDESIALLFTPDNLRETITRTPKSRAVDWEGKPLFKGHTATTHDVAWSNEEKDAAQELTRYVHQSLLAADGYGRVNALVVELVMHTFHKIAASSWIALASALRSRRDGLEGRKNGGWTEEADDDAPSPQISEALKLAEWFDGERTMLDRVISRVESLAHDSKWDAFEELLTQLEQEEPGAKLLIFTQYRVTQRYIQERLLKLFPTAGVVMIHGELSMDERRDARRLFETDARFLVSTEAGGEGINLHRACHLMVNYDLPWNPMRLQQRIGRLDRYGQRHVVRVFNLRVPDSWDNRISLRILERLQVVQRTMGPVTGGVEDYREMILGAIAEQIDVHRLYVDEQKGNATLSDEEIDTLVRQACDSMKRWERLFANDLGMDASHLPKRTLLTSDHFRSAYAACVEHHKLRLMETKTSEKQVVRGVYHFRIPDAFRDRRIRASQECYVVFDKELFSDVRGQTLGRARGQDIKPMLAGFGEPVTDWLFETALAAKAQESAFVLRMNAEWTSGSGWLLIATLRWMGTSRRLRAPDCIVACFHPDGGTPRLLESPELATFVSSVQETAGPHPLTPPPALEDAKRSVQAELRQLAASRDPHSRATAGWSWWIAARIAG
jgi:superfamily II DNA or RNA helicase